jgi:hypothetical protein
MVRGKYGEGEDVYIGYKYLLDAISLKNDAYSMYLPTL